jgi:hypothetical protein
MCSALGVVDGDRRQNAEDDDQHDHDERVPLDVAVLHVERLLDVLAAATVPKGTSRFRKAIRAPFRLSINSRGVARPSGH